MRRPPRTSLLLFFFNDTATTEIYTLSLHDALPILLVEVESACVALDPAYGQTGGLAARPLQHAGDDVQAGHREPLDRKSTRLNSSHANISYAVFCLKKQQSSNYLVCRLLLHKSNSS